MALAPYSGSTSIKPPKPPQQTAAQALAEHIAQMSGQTPSQVAAPGTYPDDVYVDPASRQQASLASLGTYSDYSNAASLIQQYLKAEGSPYANTPYARAVVKKSRKFGIDPRLLVAISGAETSLGKDPAAAPVSEHNAWGMGPGIQYGSWGQGAGAVAKNLAENYFGQGLNTIPEISSKWAPPGASNDPNNVNVNWTKNVKSYMGALSKVVGKDAAMKLFPVLGNVDWTSLGGVAAHMSRPLGNWQSDNAIDMGAPVGTPVYAPARGQLTGGFGPSDNGSTVWGNRLTLDPRAPGLPEWFMTHMGSFAPGLDAGDRVKRGELLGYIGARDSAWTPHLHFGQEFGNPETTVTKNLYDPTSAVPGAPAGNAFARQATPQDAQEASATAQQVAFAGDSGSAPGFNPFTPYLGRKKRRSKSQDIIDAIINGQAGAAMQAQYR